MKDLRGSKGLTEREMLKDFDRFERLERSEKEMLRDLTGLIHRKRDLGLKDLDIVLGSSTVH